MNTPSSSVPNVASAATTPPPSTHRRSSQRSVKPARQGKKLPVDRFEEDRFNVLILHRCSAIRIGNIDLFGLSPL